MVFFFEAANITNQILNFGLPAPIDVQVVGRNAAANYQIAQNLRQKIAAIPGAADVHIHQVVDWPEIDVNVDRNKAGQVGLTQKDVSNSLLISLASSGQVAPTQWLDWKHRRQLLRRRADAAVPHEFAGRADAHAYYSGVRIQFEYAYLAGRSGQCRKCFRGRRPQPDIRGVRQSGGRADRTAVARQPGGRGALREPGNRQPLQRAAGVRRLRQRGSQRPGFGGRRGEQDREPGLTPNCRAAPRIDVRGQISTMQSSFYRLGLGMIFAVVLVYLLMAVNFQSWLDPFIILMALPGALAGIVWMLFLTQTTFSVPSLMGAIMCIGVATANSILMVVFANDQREEGMDARAAALSAGHTRIRPVIMTASAMIIGMLPMALGLGEGGEQNAPLGRAVIGGLILATITTLVCGSIGI